MGAAVLEGVEAAVHVAGDDDRNIADEGRAPVAGRGYLGLEAEIVPHRAHEDAIAFLGIDVLARVELIGNARHALIRPNQIEPVRHGFLAAAAVCAAWPKLSRAPCPVL